MSHQVSLVFNTSDSMRDMVDRVALLFGYGEGFVRAENECIPDGNVRERWNVFGWGTQKY